MICICTIIYTCICKLLWIMYLMCLVKVWRFAFSLTQCSPASRQVQNLRKGLGGLRKALQRRRETCGSTCWGPHFGATFLLCRDSLCSSSNHDVELCDHDLSCVNWWHTTHPNGFHGFCRLEEIELMEAGKFWIFQWSCWCWIFRCQIGIPRGSKGYPLVICYIAIENDDRNSELSVPLKIIIFNSYVKLPEGTYERCY